MRMFAHPFRISSSGSVVTVDETSDEGISQLIAAAVLTNIGERPLFPTFGITDPVFGEVSAAQVSATLSAYGPPARIVSVKANFTDSATQQVEIGYVPDGDEALRA